MIGDRDDVDRFAPQLSSQIRRNLENRHLNSSEPSKFLALNLLALTFNWEK